MSNTPNRNTVCARESGIGPYGQYIHAGHHILGADEPAANGGQDTGPDPFELVMAGLAACTTMTIRMVANRKNLPLTDVRTEVRHVRTPTETERHKFERKIILTGPLTDADRAMLVAIGDKCPVHKLLAGNAEIVTCEAE